jgi:hypothetical protein
LLLFKTVTGGNEESKTAGYRPAIREPIRYNITKCKTLILPGPYFTGIGKVISGTVGVTSGIGKVISGDMGVTSGIGKVISGDMGVTSGIGKVISGDMGVTSGIGKVISGDMGVTSGIEKSFPAVWESLPVMWKTLILPGSYLKVLCKSVAKNRR